MPKRYETTNMALSAFLRLKGIDLLEVKAVGPRLAKFVFADSDQRSDLVYDFFQNRNSVAPLDYITSFKDLKSLALEKTREYQNQISKRARINEEK